MLNKEMKNYLEQLCEAEFNGSEDYKESALNVLRLFDFAGISCSGHSYKKELRRNWNEVIQFILNYAKIQAIIETFVDNEESDDSKEDYLYAVYRVQHKAESDVYDAVAEFMRIVNSL